MLSTIIIKELRSIILSPKFIGSFLVSSLLILLSVYIGINDFRRAQRSYEESVNLTDVEMQQKTSWGGMSTRVSRLPEPMQVFISGVNNDVGRRSIVSTYDPVKLFGSFYSEETLYALFRYFDLAFIIQVVLSLFAILFTYDSINGEKETGTIQLSFSNPLPRAQFILGKFIGACLGLLIPLAVPLLLGILLILIMKVPFAPADWLRFACFMGVSLLYIIFFVCLGILTSILTKQSRISFLISLVVWVLLVFIVPRIASMAAGQLVQVPSVAEMDSQRDTFAKDRWNQHSVDLEKIFQQRNALSQGMNSDDQQKYRDAHDWEWMQQDDSLRRGVIKSIDDYGIRLNEDFRNRKIEQEKLTYSLSRVSPAAAYQLASMRLAQTDVAMKARYEDAMNTFRTAFNAYTEKKQAKSGGAGGIRISFDSNSGFKISTPRENPRLDLSDAPSFQPPRQTNGDIFGGVIVDMGILSLGSLLAFGITFTKFQRYDLT